MSFVNTLDPKYAASVFSSITSKNYLSYYCAVRPKLPPDLQAYYDEFIKTFFSTFVVHDTPLSDYFLDPLTEMFMREILLKVPAAAPFPEEIAMMKTIDEAIESENIEEATEDYAALLNFRKLLNFDNVESLPLLPRVEEELYRLLKFNWAFDKSYSNALNADSKIINIGGLHNSIKNL